MSDLIDRHEAIRDIRLMDVCVIYDDMCSTEEAVEKAIVATKRNAIFGLECINSAEPRKKGKWIYGEKSGQDGWYCSECGGFIPWYYDFYGLDNIDFIEDFKTCPFCDSKMVSYTGADMEEGEEG